MEIYERPLKVRGERVWRTWPGGRELDRLQGLADPRDGSFPEEWMLSVTRARSPGREDIEEGICYLSGVPEKISLRHLLEKYPREMLGAEHAARFGGLGVLVKLIDAGARLQVQAHPDRAAAERLFSSPYGKTECWHILGLRQDAEEEPCLYLGFRPGVSENEWRGSFERQDSPAMLSMLHRIVPRPGETYLVRGGVPHAIGAGILLAEIQEPTDITIRMERRMPYGPELPAEACHQGLGFDRMFECFSYEGKTYEEALDAWRLPARPVPGGAEDTELLVGYDDTECFRMERIVTSGSCRLMQEGVFSGLYVTGGSGNIVWPGGRETVTVHDQLFLPAGCPECTLESGGGPPLRVLRFFGPDPAGKK